MSREQSSIAAILVGAGFSLTTAAAAELGAPEAAWIVAAVLGALSFIAAIVLYATGSPERPTNKAAGRPGSGDPFSLSLLLVIMGLAVLLVVSWVLVSGVDIGGSAGGSRTVIVCIDSSASTDRVRESYLRDLKKVVLQAALRQADFYAANCGVNATGNVNWPVRRRFDALRGGAAARAELYLQAEEVFHGGLESLVATRPGGLGVPLGEVLAVMARQCGQAGGDCTIYLFTDGEWSDGLLTVRDGVSDRERRRYLKAYLPQLQDLAGSRVDFIGVGYGTSLGEVHLGEARELASDLIEGAGAEMGAWTTRF